MAAAASDQPRKEFLGSRYELGRWPSGVVGLERHARPRPLSIGQCAPEYGGAHGGDGCGEMTPDGFEIDRLGPQSSQCCVHCIDLVLDVVGKRASPSPDQVRPAEVPWHGALLPLVIK